MGTEDHVAVIGYLVEFVDEDRAFLFQVVDHVAIVHDFVAHIDRRAEQLDRALDDFDRTVDAGAKSAGVGEQYLHQWTVCSALSSPIDTMRTL